MVRKDHTTLFVKVNLLMLDIFTLKMWTLLGGGLITRN